MTTSRAPQLGSQLGLRSSLTEVLRGLSPKTRANACVLEERLDYNRITAVTPL
jgi:hypothetical protein